MGGGDVEDWQRRADKQCFFGGVGAIKAASFSQCGAVAWDSVIDCGCAC